MQRTLISPDLPSRVVYERGLEMIKFHLSTLLHVMMIVNHE
jgi:hypothetical protein